MREYGHQQTGKLIVISALSNEKSKQLQYYPEGATFYLDSDGQVVPHFFEVEKINGVWGPTDRMATNANEMLTAFTGDLVKISLEKKEFYSPGTKKLSAIKESVKMLFRSDATESLLFSTSFKISSRNFLNNLITLDTFDDLKVKIFRNKAGFETLMLLQHNELVRDGLLSNEEAKAKIKINVVKGIETSDPTELNDFLKEKVLELAKKLEASRATYQESHATHQQKDPVPAGGSSYASLTEKTDSYGVESDDEIPF